MHQNKGLPYREALIALGGYGALITGAAWLFVAQPGWSFVVGILVASSFPLIRVPPGSSINGRRRHGLALGIGLAVTILAVIVAGATAAKAMSPSNASDDSPGLGAIVSILIVTCAASSVSAIAHVWAMLDADAPPGGAPPVRSRSDEIQFFVAWAAIPCILVAAGWSTSAVPAGPWMALVAVWLVALFVALVVASQSDEQAMAGLRSMWSNLLGAALAAGVLVAAWATLVARSGPEADAAAWTSAIVGLASVYRTGRAIAHLPRGQALKDTPTNSAL